MKKMIEKMLEEGKVRKHYTFPSTGIVVGNCRKVSGSAGSDVDVFYIDPKNKEIELVGDGNTHYGYASIREDGYIHDNSNRSVFEIV